MKSAIDFANQIKDYAAAGKAIASVENGTTAVGSYAVGGQFIREGVLYKAKTSITAGDTLTLNTNYELADDLDTQIGNVKQALSNQIGTGSKNLLPRPYASGNTLESGGITYTVNADGSVTASGTAAGANINFNLEELNAPSILKKGTYIFSVEGLNNSNLRVLIGAGNSGLSAKYLDASNPTATFTITEDYKTLGFCVLQTAAAGATSGTVKMMIRDASISDSTYEPYYPQNKELLSYKDNGVLGAKNLLPISLSRIKSVNSLGTWNNNVYTYNGGTFTVTEEDGLVTEIVANGTFSTKSYLTLTTKDDNISMPQDGAYTFNGVRGGSSTTYGILVNYYPSSSSAESALSNVYDGDVVLNIKKEWIMRLYCVVEGTVNNVSYKPMIRLATDTDPTYQPFAMTNKQLTDVAQQVENNYVLNKVDSISVTGDGTKTYQKLLLELWTAVNTYISSHTDETIELVSINISGYGTFNRINDGNNLRNGTLNTFTYFQGYVVGNLAYMQFYHIILCQVESNGHFYYWLTNAGNTNVNNYDSAVAASGSTISVTYKSYKKIS